ncbi:hypothetical protein ACFFX0_32670 [Citricoccus parietis]|uniref:Uncharacterized protein n=1 Tax=Citricoccus parietis TaxID=592307 RepID=A0ABV5G9P5_9MICC
MPTTPAIRDRRREAISSSALPLSLASWMPASCPTMGPRSIGLMCPWPGENLMT